MRFNCSYHAIFLQPQNETEIGHRFKSQTKGRDWQNALKKNDPTVYCLQETPQIQRHKYAESKRMEKYTANSTQKRAIVAILM